MKILYLTNHLNGDDGWSRYSKDVIIEIQNQGNEVLCLCSEKSYQNKIKEIVVLKEPLKYLVNPILILITFLKVKKIIRSFTPDIIHFLVEPYSVLLLFLNLKDIKTFITIHGTYSYAPNTLDNNFKKIISSYFTKKVYNNVYGIISVSKWTKDYLLDYFSKVKSKVKVITNGINLKEHKIANLDDKPQNKIKTILFVGAVKQRKGIIEAIEALSYYKNNFSNNFIYNIVGSYNKKDNYYKKIKQKIQEYGLEDMVLFKGRVSEKELENCYRNADLFLMLSINNKKTFEGFGLVYLEANAKGVPCIGPDNSGAKEAILNGKTGYVVNPYAKEKIAEKIDLVLNKKIIDPGYCIKWAKQNSIIFKAKDIIALYKSSLNNNW